MADILYGQLQSHPRKSLVTLLLNILKLENELNVFALAPRNNVKPLFSLFDIILFLTLL